MVQCDMEDKPIHYTINEMGLWGDAFRERKVIIVNDYETCNRPSKHGYPKGHVKVKRHMNGPVIKDEKVIAIIGVGNKIAEYNQRDIEIFNELVQKYTDKILELQILAFSEDIAYKR